MKLIYGESAGHDEVAKNNILTMYSRLNTLGKIHENSNCVYNSARKRTVNVLFEK